MGHGFGMTKRHRKDTEVDWIREREWDVGKDENQREGVI